MEAGGETTSRGAEYRQVQPSSSSWGCAAAADSSWTPSSSPCSSLPSFEAWRGTWKGTLRSWPRALGVPTVSPWKFGSCDETKVVKTGDIFRWTSADSVDISISAIDEFTDDHFQNYFQREYWVFSHISQTNQYTWVWEDFDNHSIWLDFLPIKDTGAHTLGSQGLIWSQTTYNESWTIKATALPLQHQFLTLN
jgi:hypothetical protein